MSSLYNVSREQFAGTELSWVGDSFRTQLLTANYTFNAAHQNLSDVAAGGRVASSPLLTGKERTDGYCSADPLLFAALTFPADVTQYLVYKDTGVESTSTLVCWSANVKGWPFRPTGGDYILNWGGPNGAVFRI